VRVRVGILVGGASSERETSLASGRMIAEHLPRDRHDVVVLDTLALMAAHPKLSPALRERARALVDGASAAARPALSEADAALPADLREQIRTFAATAVPATAALAPSPPGGRIDVAFVALHGPYGEDGTVVKPVREASSIGMSLVPDASAIRPSLEEAFRYDTRVLVEERVIGTELTVGLVGNEELQALPVVEIVPKRDFFDYRAKYDPTQAEEICPARIPEAVASSPSPRALRGCHSRTCSIGWCSWRWRGAAELV
jgi:D-alanine-D-alanine ligase